MRTPALALLLSVAGAAPGAEAQIAGHLDAGSGTMRTGSESPFGIVRISPSLHFNSSHFLLSADGDFAGHTEHGWQSIGRLTASARQPLGSLLEARLGIEGGASRTRWGRSAAGVLGQARLHLGTDERGVILGLGTGHSFTSGGSEPLSRIEAGGWSRVGRFDLGFWLKRTGLSVPGVESDDRTPVDTLEVGGEGRRTVQDHYTDIEASIGWARGNLAFEAGAGRRFGKTIQFNSWYVRGLYQITSRVALVASSGQFPVDVVSGLPSGAFTTFSMRFNLKKDPPALPGRHLSNARAARQNFSATSAGDGTHLIVLLVPNASVVELMGDFTDWTAVMLVPDDNDVWRLRMRIPAGLHEINMRVDGGEWQVPPGLTEVDDGLGGKAGRFITE